MGWIRDKHLITQYKSGDEIVTIGTHIHCWLIQIPFLLSCYLFGENFEKVNTDTIKRTKKTRLIHIWSNERALLLFSIENKNTVQFMKGDKFYYACRKIVLFFTNNGNHNGGTNAYILGKKRRKWLVKTNTNLELLVTSPIFRRVIDPNMKQETYHWEFVADSYKHFWFYVQE